MATFDWNKTFSYDDYKDSDDTTKLKTQLDSTLASQPAAYTSQYGDQISNTLNKIMNREAFSYDFNADPIYQQYKDQYTTQGKQAAINGAAAASTLTSGYGNSYAATAATQANQQYLTQLNNVIPELYQAALDKYDSETENLYNQYSALGDAEDRNYNQYRDTVEDWENNRDYYTDAYNNSKNFDWSQYSTNRDFAYNQYSDEYNNAYQTYRDQTADEQWQAEQDEAKREYDTSLAEQKREYDQDYALDYYTAHKSSGSGSSSGSSDGDGSMTDDAWNTLYRKGLELANSTSTNKGWRNVLRTTAADIVGATNAQSITNDEWYELFTSITNAINQASKYD